MMVWFGKVKNGKIELEPGSSLVEGAVVRIEPVLPTPGSVGAAPDPADGIGDDAVDAGVSDLAQQHDHYIYGTLKRTD